MLVIDPVLVVCSMVIHIICYNCGWANPEMLWGVLLLHTQNNHVSWDPPPPPPLSRSSPVATTIGLVPKCTIGNDNNSGMIVFKSVIKFGLLVFQMLLLVGWSHYTIAGWTSEMLVTWEVYGIPNPSQMLVTDPMYVVWSYAYLCIIIIV